MSSYGNRCWTKERALIAERLIQATQELDDVTFQETIDGIRSLGEMKAVAALAIEMLVMRLDEAASEGL